MTSKTVVIPAGVDEIVEDAIPECGRVDKLYLKEGAAIDWLPGHTIWDCVKLPQSQRDDFFGSEEPWKFITNGFFSVVRGFECGHFNLILKHRKIVKKLLMKECK